MLTLDVQAIRDFQVCSLFYDFRYRQHLSEKVLQRATIADRFEDTLKRVASFFFYKKQGESTPSYNSLLNRWEKLWYPKNMDLYDISIEQHEIAHGNISSYAKVAAAALLQLYEDFVNDQSEPILIDEKFLIPVGQDMRIEGCIDLVLRKNNHYRVLKWVGRQRRPTLESLTMNFAALKLAFEYRNDIPKPATYYLYDMGSTRPGIVHANPSPQDINTLLFWAHEINSAEFFYPRRGFTTYCRGCVFDKPCENFEFPSIEVKNER